MHCELQVIYVVFVCHFDNFFMVCEWGVGNYVYNVYKYNGIWFEVKVAFVVSTALSILDR